MDFLKKKYRKIRQEAVENYVESRAVFDILVFKTITEEKMARTPADFVKAARMVLEQEKLFHEVAKDAFLTDRNVEYGN
jgi:hypothetical protein